MRRFSREIIYQIGFILCTMICVVTSFLKFFEASYGSGANAVSESYRLARFGFAWEILVIVAAGVGAYFTFIAFNKVAVLLSGAAMCLAAIVAYTKAENIAASFVHKSGSAPNEVDSLMRTLDSGVVESTVSSSFTAAFYLFAIAAVGAIIFAICEALFINEK